MKRPFFYGWVIVAVAWVVYGFGIAPAYFSWGFFAREITEELHLTRGQVGLVFGLFTFLYSASSPLVGLALTRWNLRTIICGGSLLAASGFYVLSQAETLFGCLMGYSVLGGVGIGTSTIIPCQTLGSNWFIRSRARAIAIIMTAGGVVGTAMPPLDKLMLDTVGWRSAWVVIGGISVAVALLAALFVRDRPEDLGLRTDGDEMPKTPPDSEVSRADADSTTASSPPLIVEAPQQHEWTATQAMRTHQFFLLVISGTAYGVPWGAVAAHGRLHLEDVGFSTAAVAGLFSISIGLSIVGRLTGAIGDFLAPRKVLGTALFVEALGTGGFLIATTMPMAYVSLAMLGLGFGAAYINIAVVFSSYFGRRAFAATAGVRFMITGAFIGIGSWWAGQAYDEYRSYAVPFLTFMGVGLAGGLAAFFCRPPRHPLDAKTSG
jgi:MFS family permease